MEGSTERLTIMTSGSTNVSHVVHFSRIDYVYVWATITTCTCSMMGTLLIMYTFVQFKDLRTTSRKLLVYLSVADCLVAIGYLLGAIAYLHMARLSGNNDPWCQVPAVVTIFSNTSSFLWTVALAVYLYLVIVWNLITIANRMVWGFHVICWGVPAVISMLAVVYDVIGYDIRRVEHFHRPSVCWINTDRSDNRQWAYFTGKAWEIGSYILTASMFLLIGLHIRKETRREGEDVLSREAVTAIQSANRKLRFVPLMFILVRIWGTIRFFVDVYNPSYASSDSSDWLVVMQAMGDSSQGFANAILFCVCTRRVRRKLRRKCKCHVLHCHCFRKHQPLPVRITEFHANFNRNSIEDDLSGCSETVNINTSERIPILN